MCVCGGPPPPSPKIMSIIYEKQYNNFLHRLDVALLVGPSEKEDKKLQLFVYGMVGHLGFSCWALGEWLDLA